MSQNLNLSAPACFATFINSIKKSVSALDPSIKVIAPWRIWDIKSREDAIDYANAHNIPHIFSDEFRHL